MFCSITCKENFYAKAVDINKMLCADVKLLSDVAEHFGGVKAFDDYIKRTDLNTLNKTIFDYDLTNPEDPEYKDKLINCFLSLSTNKDCLTEKCHIRKLLSTKASKHLLSIYNLNHRDLMFEDEDGDGVWRLPEESAGAAVTAEARRRAGPLASASGASGRQLTCIRPLSARRS